MNKSAFLFILMSGSCSLFGMNSPLLREVRDFESEFQSVPFRSIVSKCRWIASGIIAVPSVCCIIAEKDEAKVIGVAGLAAAIGIWLLGQEIINCMRDQDKLDRIFTLIENETNSVRLHGALELVNDITERNCRRTRWFFGNLNLLILVYLLRFDYSGVEKELGQIRAALIMRLDELS